MNQSHKNGPQSAGTLKWWQLSLLGVAGTIGTGYFLGSSLAIMTGGPAVLFAYILAAAGTYVVFDALARMTADHPEQGSFRSYAKKAYGRWAGFGSGWLYWCSELLIMGSQLTALSIFSRFWFPNVPMWVFAAGFGLLGLFIVLIGNKGFDRTEHLLAVIKLAALVMFLILAVGLLAGWIGGGIYPPKLPLTGEAIFTKGALGLWSALIFANYAYGGIEVLGIMAYRLQKPEEAPMAGKIMLTLLGVIYAVSIGLAVTMVPAADFNPKESPFVLALRSDHLGFVPHVFNGVLIVAGFSTMSASLYAVTSMLTTLANDGDAPRFFGRKLKGKYPLPAMSLISAGLIGAIVMALVMPGKMYEYVTTAAGLMLMYNWSFILLSSGRLLKPSAMGAFKRYAGLVFIFLSVSGTLFNKLSRPGFMISLAILAVIAVCAGIVQAVRKRRGEEDTAPEPKLALAGLRGGLIFRLKALRRPRSRT